MDVTWLSASRAEVAAAMASQRAADRPSWVPTARQLVMHVNHCLMLWFLGISWFVLGVRIDTLQDGELFARDYRDIAIVTLIFAVWIAGAVWVWRWAKRPASPRSQLAEWRRALTARTNGYEVEPRRNAGFDSLISPNASGYCYPRFAAEGVEFGVLRERRPRTDAWHYAAVTLAHPVPHLVLESVAGRRIAGRLPAQLARAQRLSLEGDFDRRFQLHTPEAYERDALYILTPDVMAALVDAAPGYHVEMLDHTLLFFSDSDTDFDAPHAWQRVDRVLTEAARAVQASALRYRDERLTEQQISPTVRTVQAAFETPGTPWVEPPRRVGVAGRRLRVRDRRTGIASVLGGIGWILTLALLYMVPGLFAFAGFMSIIDGH